MGKVTTQRTWKPVVRSIRQFTEPRNLISHNVTDDAWFHILEENWKTDLKEVITKRLDLKGFYSIKIYLPYGVVENNGNLILKKIVNKNEKGVYLVNLEISQLFKKRQVQLNLDFPAKFIPQKVNIKKFFFYSWHKNYVSLSYLIGTTKVDIIEKQLKKFLSEAQIFYRLYCQTESNLEIF